MPTSSSHLWVETNDFKSWVFVLGVPDGRENIAADWMVELRMDSTAATVGTTRWLTEHGALVHGSHHDALREDLLRALALGKPTESDGEAEISAKAQRDLLAKLKITPPRKFTEATPATS